MPTLPDLSIETLGRRCLVNLESAVRVDTQSDENSTTIPSTPGQRILAEQVAARCMDLGAQVSVDDSGNAYAFFAGHGAGARLPPVAMMVHLDTAKGTHAVDGLALHTAWDGGPIPFADNEDIRVDIDNYPETRVFLDQTVVHGGGRAPFGLDDKLGLAQLLTLVELLQQHPVDHPPVLLVGRPDEEIGRFDALHAVVEQLRQRGVRSGYTIDGIHPFEVNTENFNAARARVRFPANATEAPGAQAVFIGGVNTHGATAKAEGYRSAVRLVGELADAGVLVFGFASDDVRECDGVALLAGPDVPQTLEAVVGAHASRGASWRYVEQGPDGDTGIDLAFAFTRALLTDAPGFPIRASESDGRQGYSNPYRIFSDGDRITVDVRVRDFDPEGLDARRRNLEGWAACYGAELVWEPQYVNMGPRLAPYPELVRWAQVAGEGLGEVVHQPIRGGTGVDPFLDAGVPIANLGTGYFAPESEKELTTIELMGRHVAWLYRLVQVIAEDG